MKRVVLAGVLALASGTARAESQSWSALKTGIPGGASMVVTVDVAALRGSPVFDRAVAAALGANPDAELWVFQVSRACKLDVTKIIDDIAVEIDAQGRGALVIGLAPKIDEARVHDCLTELARATSEREALVSVRSEQTGGVTKYWLREDRGRKDPLYLAWLRNDVVAIGFTPGKPAELEALIAANGVNPKLAGWLAKSTTGAPVGSIAVAGADHIRGGFATVKLAKAAFAIDVHLTMDDAAMGAKRRADTKSELAGIAKQHAAKYPGVTKVLAGVTIGGTGADLTLTATVRETDVPDFLANFDHVF